MKREFDVLIERDQDGYYVATVPALCGCQHYLRHTDGRATVGDLLFRSSHLAPLVWQEGGLDEYQAGGADGGKVLHGESSRLFTRRGSATRHWSRQQTRRESLP